MLILGAIGFLAPWALSALVLLPLLWWLLRIMPPKPKVIAFPAVRFLLGLNDEQETPDKTPLWLIALRTLLAIAIITAFAEPLLNPSKNTSGGSGPMVIVVDDTWIAASQWKARQTLLITLIDEAARTSRPVAIETTATRVNPAAPSLKSAQSAKETAQAITPKPFTADRLKAAARLKKAMANAKSPEVFWLSDGMDYGNAKAFSEILATLGDGSGSLKIVAQSTSPNVIALRPPAIKDGDLRLRAISTRKDLNAENLPVVRALASNGRSLGQSKLKLSKDGNLTATLVMPAELRNRIRKLEIADQNSAGAVYLLDDRWRRRPVGLVSGGSVDLAQPLLSPLYYVERALSPFAQTKLATGETDTSAISSLLSEPLAMLILADVGKLVGLDEVKVTEWVQRGGVLIRFAGPRLANLNDNLLPVELRRGGRALGGALTWGKPQQLAEFPDGSPFIGLKTNDEISITRQVLAEPTPDLPEKTWARLRDGTPLVTAAQKGAGLVVLFHVTANSDWSNLPLSGLFVDMLRRILDQSHVIDANATGTKSTAKVSTSQPVSLLPIKTLDGFGILQSPPATVEPIISNTAEKLKPSAIHPPGLYGTQGSQRALNIIDNKTKLVLMPELAASATHISYVAHPPVPLKSWMLIIALILLLADTIAILFLTGRIAGLFKKPAVLTPVIAITVGIAATIIALSLSGTPARAQTTPQTSIDDINALRASLITRLAYVITGKERVDNVSAAGLTGLSIALHDRTSLEPGRPIGINIERDELAFFPLLYWPITPDAPALSDKAVARIDTYMKNGGTIFFDTRDAQLSVPDLNGNTTGPGGQRLQTLLAKLDIPLLENVPATHVLTKAFYLLQSFPGRWTGGELWVEATSTTPGTNAAKRSTNHDGVSTIIIGSNDYAAAWAKDRSNRYLFPIAPGGPRQRELAYRTGINIVMYALTGNYKADQVHLPALLERLGQ